MKVIGKVQAPKRGAAFGDVPVETVFDAMDPEDPPSDDGHPEAVVRWVKYTEHTAYQLTAPIASLKGTNGIRFPLDWSIRPLTVTPTEQPPDPAVTTYGELEPSSAGSPWEFFMFETPGDDRVLLRTEEGHVRPDSACDTADNDAPVRRVPASVVVHAEPGSHASLGTRDGEQVFYVGDGIDGVELDRDDAERTLQQLAAALAQRAASPESEPLVDGGDGDGYCPVCNTEQEGYPCLHPASEVAAVKMSEPAEDRSKPAPGWVVDELALQNGWWAERTCHRDGKAFASEEKAIAYTWAQHDAQQAGEGEGS